MPADPLGARAGPAFGAPLEAGLGAHLQSVQETSEVWWALRRHEWARRTGYRS